MSADPPEPSADAFVLSPLSAPRRRRRRGVNYGLLMGVVAVVGLVAVVAAVRMGPKVAGSDLLGNGVPSVSAAQQCIADGDLPCAEADYRAYLKQYPNDAHALGVLAIVLTRDGQHRQAVPYYQRALALTSGTYDLYAGYAISLDNVGRLDDAIAANQASLRIVPNLVDVRGSLADQLVRKGRVQEALQLLESFDRQQEDRGEPGFFVGQIAQIRRKAGLADAGADASPAQAAAPGTSEIRLIALGGELYTPVMVDGAVTMNFVVDSGATDVSLSADAARTLMRMGLLTPADYLGQGQATLADDSRIPTRAFVLRSLSVGGRQVRNITAMVSNKPGPLLLGQSFLRRFKSWSVDNRRRVLILTE